MLVTHHLDLCLPKTKYAILLGRGTVEHAGFIDDLRKTGIIDKVLQQDEIGRKKQTNMEELLVDRESNGGLLGELPNNATRDAKIDDSEVAVRTVQPKKFTAEEERETGAIKFGIYKEYLKTSGGWWFWILVLIMFFTHQGLVLGRVSLSAPFFLAQIELAEHDVIGDGYAMRILPMKYSCLFNSL